jgi:hypothetical protein
MSSVIKIVKWEDLVTQGYAKADLTVFCNVAREVVAASKFHREKEFKVPGEHAFYYGTKEKAGNWWDIMRKFDFAGYQIESDEKRDFYHKIGYSRSPIVKRGEVSFGISYANDYSGKLPAIEYISLGKFLDMRRARTEEIDQDSYYDGVDPWAITDDLAKKKDMKKDIQSPKARKDID